MSHMTHIVWPVFESSHWQCKILHNLLSKRINGELETTSGQKCSALDLTMIWIIFFSFLICTRDNKSDWKKETRDLHQMIWSRSMDPRTDRWSIEPWKESNVKMPATKGQKYILSRAPRTYWPSLGHPGKPPYKWSSRLS